MNIHFIGFGAMAKAIAHKLAETEKYRLSASAPSLPIGVTPDQIKTHFINAALLRDTEIVLLAVKPKIVPLVLAEIAPNLSPGCIVVSIAAGVPLQTIAKHSRNQQPIVRTMPNTPVAIGLGATPMIANQYVTIEQKQRLTEVFSQLGLVTWINNEALLDSFTALSGSGPAYVFLFLEAMIDAGIAIGIDAKIAKAFVLQTCEGALKLVEEQGLELDVLRAQVTSPGGTTAAALQILKPQLNELLYTAIIAAKTRATELGNIKEIQ